MDAKPTNWVGTCKDQQELFTEILAYLIARKVMDRKHYISSESFMRVGRKLLNHGTYYTKAIKHFDKFLTTWEVEYDNETGIKNKKLNNDGLLKQAYQSVLCGIASNSKSKKYEAVYEELE
jgi:hypothetical protein